MIRRLAYFQVFYYPALVALMPVSAYAEPPSFFKQVQPVLAKYCVECHNADKLKGGLNLESFKNLAPGGKHGPVLVSGKPDESRLVLLVEKKAKPSMPPRKAAQPHAEEVAV